MVLTKTPPPTDHTLRLSFDGNAVVRQRSLATPGPWILVPDRARQAIDEFLEAGTALSDIAPPALGVKTGADPVLVGALVDTQDGMARVRFGEIETIIEQSVLRSALRGRDIGPFSAASTHVVLWTHSDYGDCRSTLPPCAGRYVSRNGQVLRNRADYRAGPLWTLFRTRSACATHRVVWPDIARRPRSVALEASAVPNAIPLNTCYIAVAPSRSTALVITAVLNSTWSAAYTAVTADEARGGYRRLNARNMGALPIPDGEEAHRSLSELSQQAHQLEHADQDELDDAVAGALALSQGTQAQLRELAHRRGV